MIGDLIHDVRSRLRALRQSPAFTVTAVVILGLGAGTTLMTVAETLFLEPPPEARDVRDIVLDGEREPFAAVPLALVAVAALASWRPAWRTARIDPMAALRED